MLARKCDKCGNYYDVYFMRIKRGAGTYETVNGVRLFERSFNDGVSNCLAFDLCPECMHKALEFLGVKEVGDNE